MAENFSTPDDLGPITASELRAADQAFHAKQIAHGEMAATVFVLVLLVVFGVQRLWRKARNDLSVPVRMPDPMTRPD